MASIQGTFGKGTNQNHILEDYVSAFMQYLKTPSSGSEKTKLRVNDVVN